MKRYRILKRIILGFCAPRDQYDVSFDPEANVILESDGDTIWTIKDGERRESITVGVAIKLWLEEGLIEEIPSK